MRPVAAAIEQGSIQQPGAKQQHFAEQKAKLQQGRSWCGRSAKAIGWLELGGRSAEWQVWREAALPLSLPSTTASLSSICGTNSSGWLKNTGFSVDGLSAGCSRTNLGRGRDMAASGERRRAAGGVCARVGAPRRLNVPRRSPAVGDVLSHARPMRVCTGAFEPRPQGRRTVVSISAIGQAARTSRAHQLPHRSSTATPPQCTACQPFTDLILAINATPLTDMGQENDVQ